MKRKVWKKVFGVVLLSLLILCICNVSAQVSGEEAGLKVRSLGVWISDLIKVVFFGDSTDVGPLDVATHLFMGLILFLMVYSSIRISNMFKRTSFNWIVSIAVTTIILINLPKNFFSIVLPSYGALGALILILIPIVIVFFFSMMTKSLRMGRMVWILFSFYYLIFWVYEYMKIDNPSWMNLVAGIFGVVMVFSIGIVREFYVKDKTKYLVQDIHHRSELRKVQIETENEELEALSK